MDVAKNENREKTVGQKSWIPAAAAGRSVTLNACLSACTAVWVFERVHAILKKTKKPKKKRSALLGHLSTAGEQTSGEREKREGQRKRKRGEKNIVGLTAGTKVI